MSNTSVDKAGEDQLTVEQWLQIRKETGLRIDPETAEVLWNYEYTLDPYGVSERFPATKRTSCMSVMGRGRQFATYGCSRPHATSSRWSVDYPRTTAIAELGFLDEVIERQLPR